MSILDSVSEGPWAVKQVKDDPEFPYVIVTHGKDDVLAKAKTFADAWMMSHAFKMASSMIEQVDEIEGR